MRTLLLVAMLALTPLAVNGQQSGPPTAKAEQLESEILISTLAAADLRKQVMAANGKIEHISEVARGGPVAAVLRVTGCQKNAEGICRVNADITVQKPDGSVYTETKNLDLPEGRGAVPLKFDTQAATGVYTVIATVRDLETRRFARVERKFGVK